MLRVDESKLNRVDRLGLAWCRLNCYEWDEIIGAKPDGFDDLPDMAPKRKPWQKRKPSKADYIRPAREAIEEIIGVANCSRCWWLFILEETEEKWLRWYVTKRLRG